MNFRLIVPLLLFGAALLAGCTTREWYATDTAIAPGDMKLNVVLTPCDTLPRFLSGKSPYLPPSSRDSSGKVVIEFTIDETGEVHKIIGREEIGHDFLSHTASAALGWRFSPALKNGQPIAVQVRQTFYFGDLTEDLVDPAGRANERAGKAMLAKQYHEALAQSNEIIRLEPYDVYRGYYARAQAYQGLHDFTRAVADLNEVLRLNPNSAETYNGLAWLQATAPDAGFRDGALAVSSARRACELTGWMEGQMLDTLAAAYAEAGDFDRAVAWQIKAIKSPSTKLAKLPAMKERLRLYQQRRPYREQR